MPLFILDKIQCVLFFIKSKEDYKVFKRIEIYLKLHLKIYLHIVNSMKNE